MKTHVTQKNIDDLKSSLQTKILATTNDEGVKNAIRAAFTEEFNKFETSIEVA